MISSRLTSSHPSRSKFLAKIAKAKKKPQARTSSKPKTQKPETAPDTPDSDGIFDRVVDTVQGIFTKKKTDTSLAEARDADARVAVFDSFNGADEDGVSTHGEKVEGVIQREGVLGDEDVQRYHIGSKGSLNRLQEQLAEGDEDAFDQYIEDRYLGRLDNTSDAIEELLDDEDAKVTVVNQSQSIAEGRVARDIWNRSKEDEEFRADLADALGFDENVSDRELAQGLVDGVGESVANNDKIADAQERYDELSEELSDAGIVHVVTSGNLGRFADELEDLGVHTDRQFYDSALANNHKIVVAATDNDNRGAVFNSPHAEADLAALGVDVRIRTQDGEVVTASGTSFAAPTVSATVARIQEVNPDLSPKEIRKILENSSEQIHAPFSDVGHGTLDSESALDDSAAWEMVRRFAARLGFGSLSLGSGSPQAG